MDNLGLTPEVAQSLIKIAGRLDEAQVLDTAVRQDIPFQVVRINLDGSVNNNAANAIPIFGRFKSFAVTGVSDSTVQAYLIVNHKDDAGGIQRIGLIQGVSHDFGQFQNQAFAYWTTAQAGRWIEVTFFLRGVYKNNTINLNNAGGYALLDGSSITTDAAQNANGSAAILIAQNLSRKAAIIENQGTAPIYLGASNVTVPGGANPGITLLPGAQAKWNNTGALYGITSGATVAVAVNEES